MLCRPLAAVSCNVVNSNANVSVASCQNFTGTCNQTCAGGLIPDGNPQVTCSASTSTSAGYNSALMKSSISKTLGQFTGTTGIALDFTLVSAATVCVVPALGLYDGFLHVPVL
jgi:hypothetical protein